MGKGTGHPLEITNRKAPLHLHSGLTHSKSYTVLDIELDPGCSQSVAHQYFCRKSNSDLIPLYKFDELPHFLRINPYIKDGYRSLLPASACFYSLFYWNNESINVWSHLLGFFIFFLKMIYSNISFLSREDTLPYVDYIYIIMGLLCYQICMLLSAGYHLLYCHSEKACRRWFSLDLAGICVGIVGCYLPGIHLAFFCHQVWRDFYMFIVAILGAFTLALQFHPSFLTSAWSTKRSVLYCSVVGYGVIPACHWVYLNGGFDAEVVQLFFSKVIMMYLLGIIAFSFYTTRFPERLFPGKVDYLGASHQWWHFMVVISFLYWNNAGEVILQYRIEKPCIY